MREGRSRNTLGEDHSEKCLRVEAMMWKDYKEESLSEVMQLWVLVMVVALLLLFFFLLSFFSFS